MILKIDRSVPFNPGSFLREGRSYLPEGWSIIEQDERSLALTEIDLTKISLETMLKSGEEEIVGEEKLRRLKVHGGIRLDARVLQTLLENQHTIPASWWEATDGRVTNIFFDGTILMSPEGHRCVLWMSWSWDEDGGWMSSYESLDFDWCDSHPSAVLAS